MINGNNDFKSKIIFTKSCTCKFRFRVIQSPQKKVWEHNLTSIEKVEYLTTQSFKYVFFSTGSCGYHVNMFVLHGLVQTKTAWQCVLSETSKTSGEWHSIV